MKELREVLVLLAACGACFAAFGFDLQVSVWRGESASFLVSDEFPDVGGNAPGVTVRRGTLLPVRYNTCIGSLEYRYVADRAVYGSKDPGLHFATVTAAADAKAGEYRFGQLVVRVVDRVLPPPREWKYFVDFWHVLISVRRLFTICRTKLTDAVVPCNRSGQFVRMIAKFFNRVNNTHVHAVDFRKRNCHC